MSDHGVLRHLCADAPVYLRLPSVVAVGGSWMIAPALRERDFASVSRLAEQAVLVGAQARP
jgi:2-keto-3-deoxy-6-phosphogluconate aldolase